MPVYISKNFWIHRRTAGNVNPEVFFIPESFQHEKRISQTNQGDMMMPALPRTAFEMIQTPTLFSFPVILVNPITTLCFSNQTPPSSTMGIQTGEPKFYGLFTLLRPFDQQFFRRHFHGFSLNQPIGHPNDHPSKTRTERPFRSLSPSNVPQTLGRQVFSNLSETSGPGKLFSIKPLPMYFPPLFHRKFRGMRILVPCRQVPFHRTT